MTKLLIRKFIKNPEDVTNNDVRTRYGIMASIVGIFCNVLLFAGKFVAGFIMHSIAVTADSFNNLSDAASNIISLVGVKMASRPADEEHPFGHGRIEYISALVVAFIILEVGFSLLKEAVGKIRTPEEISFDLVLFIILGVSVLVKLWMGVFNGKIGRKISSKVLIAAATDSIGDVVVTGITMVSILVDHFIGINIDGWAGVVVSLVVMYAGFSVAKDTIEPLIGESEDPEMCRQIAEMVGSYDGIVGTHDLIVHNYGPNRSMASIHAEVPNDVSIEVSHEIIDRAEKEVSKKLGIVLVIHMDPVETKDEKTLAAKSQVAGVLKNIDAELSFHDFRMVNGQRQINLIFDLVTPFVYDKEKTAGLLHNIRRQMKDIDKRYECVITVDRSFVQEEEPKKEVREKGQEKG